MRTHREVVPDGTPGVRRKLQRLRQLVELGKHDADVRSLALRALRRVPERAWSREIDALNAAVRRRVRYTMDPVGVELFVEPGRLLGEPMGDCDDHVALLGSMLEAVGHPVRFKVGGPGRDRWGHVWLEVYDRGQGAWRGIDPIAKNQALGYDPSHRFAETMTMAPPSTTYGGSAGLSDAMLGALPFSRIGRVLGRAAAAAAVPRRRPAAGAIFTHRRYEPGDVTRGGPPTMRRAFMALIRQRRGRPGADRLTTSSRRWDLHRPQLPHVAASSRPRLMPAKPYSYKRDVFTAPQKALPDRPPLGAKVSPFLALKSYRWDLGDYVEVRDPFLELDGMTLEGWKKLRRKLKRSVKRVVKKVGRAYAKAGKYAVKFGKKLLPYAGYIAAVLPGTQALTPWLLQAAKMRKAYLARKRAGQQAAGGLPPEIYEQAQQTNIPGVPEAAAAAQRIQELMQQWSTGSGIDPSFQTPSLLPQGTTLPAGGGGFPLPPGGGPGEPLGPGNESGMPSWALPAIIGGVGLLLVVMMQRRR